MENKIAMVVGVTGQDGSYLSELLLSRGYTVVGIKRRTSTNTTWRISHLLNSPNFIVQECDITDPIGVFNLLVHYKPAMVFFLAAQSHVHTSFANPIHTLYNNITSVGIWLEAIKNISANTKWYFAASSEMFGAAYTEEHGGYYQDEHTPFIPQSPYAITKVAGYHLTKLYRQYGVFGCNGVLFNHDSMRRGEEFVTRKITRYIGDLYHWLNRYKNCSLVSDVKNGIISISGSKPEDVNMKFPLLKLGNIGTMRDFGHAADYVRAMLMMMEYNTPDDYVIATGESHTIQEFADKAFRLIGQDYRQFIIIDKKLYRPAEVNFLQGRSTKAEKVLGWKPTITFEQLIQEMVAFDIQLSTQR